MKKSYRYAEDRVRLIARVGAIVVAALFSFEAHAWMGEWAPTFKCASADVEVLSETSVSNYVSTVGHVCECHCEGYKLDLNGDGIKDFVYLIPWMGSGLAGDGYCVHFRVSAGANGWVDTILDRSFGVTKDDLVNVGGKIYFRHSACFGYFEKSGHNHWVYQVFSFDKDGVMRCSNRDFGELFPAVTIYYYENKFKQIELTKNDRKFIENETRRHIQSTVSGSIVGKDKRVKMVINSAAKKKEANDWKPVRKLTKVECAKLMRIMTKRFGEPGKRRTGEDEFEYAWRFEGDECLTIGVTTIDDSNREVGEIHDWEWKKLRPISEERLVRFGVPYEGAPKNCKLLYECGWIALFAGETTEDVAHKGRRSLFARLRMEEGTELWRLVLTTGSSWKVGERMNSWSQNMESLIREDFCVRRARASMDGRTIWLVCNPHTDLYNVVCRFDLEEKTFKVLIDGDTAEEQADGTILVKDKKVYLQDANGEPDGAAWCDVWITPDGKVVKKTKPVRLYN